MNELLKKQLIIIAKDKMADNDPSHDISHALRALALSEKIAIAENADLDIIIPSAIFHDVISYPKNHPNRFKSSKESAEFAKIVLRDIKSFPKDKIKKVYDSINLCSFTKAITPDFIEGKILQDADSLEATGAISIMRTFSSAGVMDRKFYDYSDPFCKNREPDDDIYALDLFYTRLLVIKNRLHTKTAKNIAKRRTRFLTKYLNELKYELMDSICHETYEK